MNLTDTIAWHREQAQFATNSGAKFPPASNPARKYVEIAAHHTRAALLMEALAVPGVAKALRLHAEALADTGDEQVAAAMVTLAKIGSDR